MQKKLFFVGALLAGNMVRAQLNIRDNAVIYLQEGAVLSIQGDLYSASDIAGQGSVLLNGSSQQRIDMNGRSLPGIRLDNPAGAALVNDIRIAGRLIFTNGRISLVSGDCYLPDAADIVGYDKDRYIITGGSGWLISNVPANAPVTFPLGSDDGCYHPLTLMHSGAIHAIGVRTIRGLPSGRDIPGGSAAIDVSWQIKDITPRSDNLHLMASWESRNEPPGFDRATASIYLFEEGQGWIPAGHQEAGPVSPGATTDNDTHALSAGGITHTGVFSILTNRRVAGGDHSITVFPNPAASGFYVHLPELPSRNTGKYSLNLVDLGGRLIASREIEAGFAGDYYFDPGEKGKAPVAGAYLLEIIRDGKVLATEKIVIAHP